MLFAFNDLSCQFTKYENVTQIKELFHDKESIVEELKQQLEEDFSDFWKSKSNLTKEDMKNACFVAEAIGIKFKNNLVSKLC